MSAFFLSCQILGVSWPAEFIKTRLWDCKRFLCYSTNLDNVRNCVNSQNHVICLWSYTEERPYFFSWKIGFWAFNLLVHIVWTRFGEIEIPKYVKFQNRLWDHTDILTLRLVTQYQVFRHLVPFQMFSLIIYKPILTLWSKINILQSVYLQITVKVHNVRLSISFGLGTDFFACNKNLWWWCTLTSWSSYFAIRWDKNVLCIACWNKVQNVGVVQWGTDRVLKHIKISGSVGQMVDWWAANRSWYGVLTARQMWLNASGWGWCW